MTGVLLPAIDSNRKTFQTSVLLIEASSSPKLKEMIFSAIIVLFLKASFYISENIKLRIKQFYYFVSERCLIFLLKEAPCKSVEIVVVLQARTKIE